MQYILLLGVLVAGQRGLVKRAALDRLVQGASPGECPIDYCLRLKRESRLDDELRAARTGKYARVSRFLDDYEERSLNLSSCSTEDLETLHGVSFKTSRFFMLYARPGARHAALDVHILRFMREQGLDVPAQAPSSAARYMEIEEQFLRLADELGIEPWELDNQEWQARALGKTD
jgi:hypothetical protein